MEVHLARTWPAKALTGGSRVTDPLGGKVLVIGGDAMRSPVVNCRAGRHQASDWRL